MHTQNTYTAEERSALFVATLTSFMGPFMISAVNVALPAIQQDFNMTAVGQSWIATAYLLAVAVVLVPIGKYADISGRKKIFSRGLLVYTIGSALSIFAYSTAALISLRIVQGVGAAMFITTGMAILTSIFPPDKRGRAIGMYVAAVYVGLSAGPFIGGFLTQLFGWRSIFAIMLPLGLLSYLVTLRFLKGEWFGERDHKLDKPACILYAFAIVALTYGASTLPTLSGFLLAAAGAVLLTLFVMHQNRAQFPVFEVRLFAINKTFAFSSLAALLNYSATFAVTFLMSLYLQYIKGMSPQTAGTVLMAQPVMMAFFSPFAGRLSDRIEPRYIATLGMGITVLGVGIFSRISNDAGMLLILGNLVFLGIGFALFSSPNMSAIMGAVEKKYYGQASGAVATMRLLGQMVSMAIATMALTFQVGHHAITPENHPQFLQSVHTVFVISMLLCTAGIYFSWSRGRLHAQR